MRRRAPPGGNLLPLLRRGLRGFFLLAMQLHLKRRLWMFLMVVWAAVALIAPSVRAADPQGWRDFK